MTRGEGGDLFKSSNCSLDPKQEPVSITRVSYTSTERPASAPGRHSCRRAMISLQLNTIRQGFKTQFVRTVGRMQRHPPRRLNRYVKLENIHRFVHVRYDSRQDNSDTLMICFFFLAKIKCILYTAPPHLPCGETWLSADRLPSLIASSSLRTWHRRGWLPVCLKDCLSRGGEGDMSPEWQDCSWCVCECVRPSSYSKIYNDPALTNTITFKHQAKSLLVSFSCPLPYILWLCRQTKGTDSESSPHDQMQQHWQPNIPSANTQHPQR